MTGYPPKVTYCAVVTGHTKEVQLGCQPWGGDYKLPSLYLSIIPLTVTIDGKALVHICWFSSCPSRLKLRNCRGTLRATESGNSSRILSFVANYLCHLGLSRNLPGFPLLFSLCGMICHAWLCYPGSRTVVALPTGSPLCAHRVE